MDRRLFLERLGLGTGLVLAPGTAAAVLSGCRPEPGAPLQFLTVVEEQLVADLTEQIIPTTDTPGARAAEVSRYIDMLLGEFSGEEVQQTVRGQLAHIQGWIESEGGLSMGDLQAHRQTALMEALDRQAFPDGGAADQAMLPPGSPPLFQRLKPWTLAGYYTSEIGATQELHQPPHGVYRGDVPLEQIGKTWA